MPTYECDGAECPKSGQKMFNECRNRAYLCPECDFRLCSKCVLRGDPYAPRHPASRSSGAVGLWDPPTTEGLWDDPTEGMRELSPSESIQPLERVWDQPTEGLDVMEVLLGPASTEGVWEHPTEEVSALSVPETSRDSEGLWDEPTEGISSVGLWNDPTSEGLWDPPTSRGLWDEPTERLVEAEPAMMTVPTAPPPPDYSAQNDCDELPPSYEECVRLGLAT